MNDALRGIYDSLTDEQKEKVKSCQTTEELMQLAGEEGIDLPDDLLDEVSGGGVSNTTYTIKRISKCING